MTIVAASHSNNIKSSTFLIYKYKVFTMFFYILLFSHILDQSLSEHIRQKRLVGGKQTEIKCYPFMVSIQLYYGLTCGGTILTSKWVLTAAHCTWVKDEDESHPARHLLVMAGCTNWIPRNEVRTRQTSRVLSIHTHPEFKITHAFNDISLLKLQIPFTLSENIRPVTLASKRWFRNNREVVFSRLCTALGWGREELKGPIFPNLREVMLQPIPNQICQIMIFLDRKCYRISDTHMCTFVLGGKKDFCKADSGGPLICDDVQVGIISLNFGCGKEETPSVWTKVDMYENWIQEIMINNVSEKLYFSYILYLIVFVLLIV